MPAFQDDLTGHANIDAIIKRLTQGRFGGRRHGRIPVAVLHAWLQGDDPANIAVISDSTGDGATLAAHTANNPGNIDWDADPRGATTWVALLEPLLQRLYPHRTITGTSPNLQVHNASASGKTVPWFLANYISRLIENKFYRTPHIAVMSLNLNDVEQLMVDKRANAYFKDLSTLGRELKRRGILLVITPADPCGLQRGIYGTYVAGTAVDNRVVEFLLNKLGEVVADLIGAVWLDHATPMKAVMNAGYGAPSATGAMGNVPRAGDLWDTSVGTPLLHGQEYFHRLKAATMAMLLCPRVIPVTGGRRQRITARFAETTFKPDSATAPVLYIRKNGQGMEERINGADAQTNMKMVEAWLWCETNEASIIYRATDGDGLTSGSAVAGHPKVQREILWSGEVEEVQAPTFGWSEQGSMNGQTYLNAHRTDQPAVVQRLGLGLVCIRYMTGTFNSERYIGYFDTAPALLQPWSDALAGIGRIEKDFPPSTGVRRSVWAPESPLLHNVLSMRRENEQHILIEGNLPDQTGWIICHNQRQLADATYGDRCGLMLFRNGNVLQLRWCHTEAAGTGWSNPYTHGDTGVVLATVTLPSTADFQRLRIRMVTGGLIWSLRVFSGWDYYAGGASTLVLSADLTASPGGPILPGLAGVVGGLFCSGGNTAGKVASIDRCIINRTPLAQI